MVSYNVAKSAFLITDDGNHRIDYPTRPCMSLFTRLVSGGSSIDTAASSGGRSLQD